MNTKINLYNCYQDGRKMVGLTDEVTLPDFDALTETLSGAGILGEIDEPTLGHFGASEIEIPFLMVDNQMFGMMDMSNSINLTLRISNQAIEQANFKTDFMPSRIVIKGKKKGFTMGSAKQGSAMKPSVKVEILYILIEVNGKKKFELDKLNVVYKVNDKDLLQKARSQC
nr:MAG TPA: tail tube protein [Caudoviricetes sp.]